jgi:toxin ParE1/3/4
MTEYIISEKALEDLNNIWIYTAENWSVEQANRYYNLIIDEIEFISENFETTKDFGTI